MTGPVRLNLGASSPSTPRAVELGRELLLLPKDDPAFRNAVGGHLVADAFEDLDVVANLVLFLRWVAASALTTLVQDVDRAAAVEQLAEHYMALPAPPERP